MLTCFIYTGKGRAAYTPFSQSLATDLLTLHSELLLQIPGCVPAVLPHLFQCLAVLVIHTPFSKLKSGLVSSVSTFIFLKKLSYKVQDAYHYLSEKHLINVHFAVISSTFKELLTCYNIWAPPTKSLPQILTESMKHLSSVGHYKVEAAALSLLCACLTVETPLPGMQKWDGWDDLFYTHRVREGTTKSTLKHVDD